MSTYIASGTYAYYNSIIGDTCMYNKLNFYNWNKIVCIVLQKHSHLYYIIICMHCVCMYMADISINIAKHWKLTSPLLLFSTTYSLNCLLCCYNSPLHTPPNNIKINLNKLYTFLYSIYFYVHDTGEWYYCTMHMLT